MNRIRSLAFLACAGLVPLLAPAVASAAEPALRIVVPRTDAAPTLDGVLAPGEWDAAAATGGLLDQLDGVAHARQATFWLSYDATHLHVACRSTAFPEELAPAVPQTWMDKDSSVVVGIDPARRGRGASPSRFVLRAGIGGETLGTELFALLDGGGDHPPVKLNAPHPAWSSGARRAQTIDGQGVWTCEVSLPLANLRAADARDGEEWGLLLGRDYSAADQAAVALSTDWRFGDGRRHFGRAFYNCYRNPGEYGRMKLGGRVPAVQMLGLGDVVGGRPAPTIAVGNPLDTPLQVALRCRYGAGAGADLQEAILTLAPRERRTHTFPERRLAPGKATTCAIAVTAVDQALLRQEIPLLPGWGGERTRPVPEFYFSGGHFAGDQANTILLPGGYDPILNQFYGRLRLGVLPEAHLAERTEIAIRRAGAPAALAVLAPRSVARPDVQLTFYDQSREPCAAILEWLCPEDGVVQIEMEGGHFYPAPTDSDGEAMQVLHVSASRSAVLVPRQVFAEHLKWKPIVARDVKVKKGDRLQFYYDHHLNVNYEDFRLRGTLTHEGIATRVFSPAGELNERQGGTSGVWFYRYDNDAKPNADGIYPELTWGVQEHWFKQRGWIQYWDKDPKKHQAMIRRVVAEGDEQVVEQKLPELEPGVYQATASVYAKDGRLLGRSRQNFIRYDHRRDLPWLSEPVGSSTRVLPSWTPIRRSGGGLTLACIDRAYSIAGSGFLQGIVNQGISQLAGPVALEAERDGKPLALQAGPAAEVAVADHQATWRGVLAGGGWRFETAAAMEYDGYVAHRLRLAPPATAAGLDRLRLVIPLKAGEATHLHAAGGEWFRGSVCSIALGGGQGVLWHSGQAYGSASDKPGSQAFGTKHMTVGSFRPYVWIGNADRGLAFMADSDEGWVPDDSRRVPAIEVVRAGDEVRLVLNLVARLFAVERPRTIAFSLQATPIRRPPDDIRHRISLLSMGTAFPGVRSGTAGWAWTGQMYLMPDDADPAKKSWLFGLPGSAPYPGSWDISAWYRKTCETPKAFHSELAIYTPYQGQHSVMTFPEIDDPRMPPGKQAGDVYGYLYPHMSHGHLEGGNPNLAQPDVDYRLWCYRHWIRGVGLKGMYFDLSEPMLTANPKAGFGYAIDLPDRPALHGRIQPGYGATRVRSFYKRLRTLFVESGVDEPYLFIHSTDANMVSAFAFAQFLFDGENHPLVNREQRIGDKIAPARQQAMRSCAGGLAYTQLEMIDPKVWNDPLVWRDVAGWYMLHDVGQGGVLHYMYNWAGIDTRRRADFLAYWSQPVAAALRATEPGTFASAWRQDNALRVLVYNRNDRPVSAVVRLDPVALGLTLPAGGGVRVGELEGDPRPCITGSLEVRGPGEPVLGGAGRDLAVTVPVLPRNYRLFKVAP